MNVQGIIGIKVNQQQGFLEDGTRIPVSTISVKDVMVTQIKTQDREGYNAVQMGTGLKKKHTKALAGHIKKAGITKTPRFFAEIRVVDIPDFTIGSVIPVAEVFKPGDIVNVTGVSKGKGFAGVVKRHHFRGGPRTHGQSDRERAPGSIGQTTTPGRVYKGKRMAGHMGNVQVTVKNLQVVDIEGDTLFLKGLIPGIPGALLTVIKVGEEKEFTPLFKKVAIPEVTVTEEVVPAESEKPAEEAKPAEVQEETVQPESEAAPVEKEEVKNG